MDFGILLIEKFSITASVVLFWVVQLALDTHTSVQANNLAVCLWVGS